MFLFKGDGAFAAVAGVEDQIIRKRKQLAGNGFYERGVISAVEVGSADRAAKERISGDEELLFAVIKKESASSFGVAGQFNYRTVVDRVEILYFRQIVSRREVRGDGIFSALVHVMIARSKFGIGDIESFSDFPGS